MGAAIESCTNARRGVCSINNNTYVAVAALKVDAASHTIRCVVGRPKGEAACMLSCQADLLSAQRRGGLHPLLRVEAVGVEYRSVQARVCPLRLQVVALPGHPHLAVVVGWVGTVEERGRGLPGRLVVVVVCVWLWWCVVGCGVCGRVWGGGGGGGGVRGVLSADLTVSTAFNLVPREDEAVLLERNGDVR